MSNKDSKVIVKDSCIGCWACIAICSDYFTFNSEWTAVFKEDIELGEDTSCIDDAIDVCPVGAIEYS